MLHVRRQFGRGCAQDVSEAKLIAQLQGEDAYAAAAAAKALGEASQVSQEAIRALVQALRDQRQGGTKVYDYGIVFGQGTGPRPVADFAWTALIAIGEPAVPALAKRLHDETQTDDERISTLDLLGVMKDVAQAALPDIERAMLDKSEDVRLRALWVYDDVGPSDAAKVAVMRRMLSDEYAAARSYAVRALGTMGPLAADAAADIAKLLTDQAERRHSLGGDFATLRFVRYDAAQALGALGEAAQPALPKLREMMQNDPDEIVRVGAALSVVKLQKDPQPGLDVLIQLLGADVQDGFARKEAVQALESLGERARPALPALKQVLQHEDALLRVLSAEAIIAIDPDHAEASVLPLLDDEDPFVSEWVIEGLSKLPELSDAAITAFLAALDKQDDWERDVSFYEVRRAAATALGKLGEKAKRALPRLERLAKEDKLEGVRSAAAEAVKQIAGDK